MSDSIIRINKMNKWFGNFHVLRDIDLNVAAGEKIVICGPSGSGKSTLIRCINRLETHQEGEIEVEGVTLDGSLNPKDGGAYSVNDIDQAHEHLESRNSVGKITVNW